MATSHDPMLPKIPWDFANFHPLIPNGVRLKSTWNPIPKSHPKSQNPIDFHPVVPSKMDPFFWVQPTSTLPDSRILLGMAIAQWLGLVACHRTKVAEELPVRGEPRGLAMVYSWENHRTKCGKLIASITMKFGWKSPKNDAKPWKKNT